MKKVIISLLFSAYFPVIILSQVIVTNKVKYGNVENDDDSYKLLSYNDSKIIYGARSRRVSKDSIFVESFILCTDKFGKELWEKKFYKYLEIEPFISNSQLFYVQRDIKSNTYEIVELDKNGGTKNVLELSDWNGNAVGITPFVKTSTGNLVIGAYADSKNSLFETHFGKLDFWLLCYNPKNELIWKKNLGGNSDDYFGGIEITPSNDGVNLLLSSYSTNNYYTNNQGKRDVCVFNLDFNGNVIWNKIIGTKNEDRFIDDYVIDKNGNIYLAFTSDDGFKNLFGVSDACIFKVTKEGKTVKSFKFITNFNSYSLGGIDLYNNSLYVHLAYGYKYTDPNINGTIPISSINNIVKLDENLIIQKVLPLTSLSAKANYPFIPSKIKVSKEGITYIGDTSEAPTPLSPPQGDFWIVTIQDVDEFSKDCIADGKLYPNPIDSYTKIIHLELDKDYLKDITLRFSDNLGRLISKEDIKVTGSKIDYNVPQGLIAGMYHLQLVCGKDVFSKKIIVH